MIIGVRKKPEKKTNVFLFMLLKGIFLGDAVRYIIYFLNVESYLFETFTSLIYEFLTIMF